MAILRSIAAWFDPRRRLMALALAGWVVLVVVAAGDGPGETGWFGLPDLGELVAAAMAVSAVVLVVVLYVTRLRASGRGVPRATRSNRALIVGTVVIVLLVLAIGRRVPIDDPQAVSAPVEDQEFVRPLGETQTEAEDDAPGVGGTDIVALVVVALAAAGLLVWSSSRKPHQPPEPDADPDRSLERVLEPALGEATELLFEGDDPRTAVLAAYAALERALSEREQARGAAETPTEHLARVLVDLPTVAASAVRLGGLYELARFSGHPITADDQRQAAESLDRAHRELATLVGDAS